MKITRVLLLLVGATLATSCGSDPTEPTIGASGSLSFSYTGAGAATSTQFSATGAIPADVATNNGSSPWAAGAVNTPSSETDVVAFVPNGSNKWDETLIVIDRTTTGNSTINVNCTAVNCTGILLIFGSNNNETNFTYFCTLTSGTVNITAVSSTNVTGTFSGSGTCTQAGIAGTTPITVTGGTFNVGVTTLLH